MQEKQHLRPAGAYDSACCLCVPRALYLSPDGKHLMQEPLPELRELRQQQGAWHIGTGNWEVGLWVELWVDCSATAYCGGALHDCSGSSKAFGNWCMCR